MLPAFWPQVLEAVEGLTETLWENFWKMLSGVLRVTGSSYQRVGNARVFLHGRVWVQPVPSGAGKSKMAGVFHSEMLSTFAKKKCHHDIHQHLCLSRRARRIRQVGHPSWTGQHAAWRPSAPPLSLGWQQLCGEAQMVFTVLSFTCG